MVNNAVTIQLEWTKLLNDLFNYQQCIYVVTYKDNNINIFSNLFQSFPLFIVSNSTFNPQTNKTEYNCTETGYIALMNDANDVAHINFEKFLPQRRIVFIYSNQIKTNLLGVMHEGLLRCMDIILISISANQQIDDILWYNENITIDEENSNKLTDNINYKLIFHRSVEVLMFDRLPFLEISNATQVGIEMEIIKSVMKDWPIDYIKYPPMSWAKMLADLNNGTGDMSITAHWQSQVITYPLDFVPYMEVRSTYLVPDAHLLPQETYVFQALSNLTWIMIIISCILIGVLIKAVSRYHERKMLNNYFLISVSFLAINSTAHGVNGYLLRGVLLMWSISCLLLTTYYSAGYTSLENVPRTSKPIRKLKDMAENKIACHIETDFTKVFLMTSENEYKREVGRNLIINRSGKPLNGLCVNADILDDDYYFMGFELIEDDFIDFKLLKEPYQTTNNVFVFVPRSLYFEPIRKGLRALFESGIVENLLLRHRDKTLYTSEMFVMNRWSINKYIFDPVSIRKVQGGFILLLVGYFVASVAYIYEILSFRIIVNLGNPT